jgi:hypothetical protein
MPPPSKCSQAQAYQVLYSTKLISFWNPILSVIWTLSDSILWHHCLAKTFKRRVLRFSCLTWGIAKTLSQSKVSPPTSLVGNWQHPGIGASRMMQDNTEPTLLEVSCRSGSLLRSWESIKLSSLSREHSKRRISKATWEIQSFKGLGSSSHLKMSWIILQMHHTYLHRQKSAN